MEGTIASILKEAAARLERAGVESPLLDAEILLAEALEKPRVFIHTSGQETIDAADRLRYEAFLGRRETRCPLAYITGTKEFWSLDFCVNEHVLVPRPETEVLVAEVLSRDRSGLRFILDLGTGSGNIAVALARELPGARILATDRSRQALSVARENAERNGVVHTIDFVASDLFSAFSPEALSRKLTLIVSNPPYIAEKELAALMPEVSRYEPREALVSGPTGLEFIQRLARESVGVLKPGGMLAFEIGHGQAEGASRCLVDNGFALEAIRKDFGGIDRVVVGRKR
jgi:release factor glutamine methyltransferase